MSYNIAIDGPASAGKSTTAKLLAKRLDYIYVETGSMYRAISVYLCEQNIQYNCEADVIKELDKIFIDIKYKDGVQHIFVNEQDVTDKLRREEIGEIASIIAPIPEVREKLLNLQRTLAKSNDVIMDGRDIGSVVLPDADLKIYLDADISTRAQRRHEELIEKGMTKTLDEVREDIKQRDYRDMTRETSPLIKADDAVVIDDTNLTKDEVLDKIVSLIKKH
ncbi:MAG: (d)CMP kinase [bacterium]